MLEKLLKVFGGGGRWYQVLEAVWGLLGLIEEIKSPCVGRGGIDGVRLITVLIDNRQPRVAQPIKAHTDRSSLLQEH